MNNWGIIGYGRIAKRFIENLKTTNGHLYAIASHSANEAPCEKLYHDYEDLLNDPQVDLIYIALPHKFHYEMILKCIEHHKPVLCEKPMVLTLEQMKDIKEKAKQSHVLVMEALKTRFIPAYHTLKEDLQTIDLESIDCGFCYYTPKSNSYLFDPTQGGALNDVGSYSIGFVLDLIQSSIVSIESDMKYQYDVDVHFNANITFENGITSHVEGAMDEKKDSIGILKGRKGTIKVPYFYRPASYCIEYTDGRVIERSFDGANDMRYEIMEMMNLVNEKKEESLYMSLDDSMAIMKVMDTIRKNG